VNWVVEFSWVNWVNCWIELGELVGWVGEFS
jgi:hypothetical protein